MILFFAGMAAFVHFYIFALESLLWSKPRTRKAFTMSEEKSEANKLFAFNQGFYNLFLAIGTTVGLVLFKGENQVVGQTLVVFNMACMLGASIVLVSSEPKLKKPAIIQGLFPLLALGTFFL